MTKRIDRMSHPHSRDVHGVRRREYGSETVYRLVCGKGAKKADGWSATERDINCKSCSRRLWP